MTDLLSILKSLHRPRLLIRAARFGLIDYNRNRDLRRLLKTAVPPSPGHAIVKLMSEESLLEDRRKTEDANYSISRHVSILIAMMGEVRLLQASSPKKAKSLAH
ncbi:MAG TPA: hypothetical protein DD729_03880 [Rhodobacteraceae bacterium]|nr:hypothetical protein [Paracoccaceae bacterium]